MQLLLCVIIERMTVKSNCSVTKQFSLKQIREGITFRIKFHFHSLKLFFSFLHL